MKSGFACVLALVIATPTLAEEVDLDRLRTSLERYQDVTVALADGYVSADDHCISAASEAMGIHYIHHELLKVATTGPSLSGTGTHTDWSRPAILLYEPQADGSLQLVAIENLVFEAAWIVAFRDEELVLNGRSWDHMADAAGSRDGAHGFAPHYGQHVWLWRDNPAGVLMPFNTNVTCEHHRS
jgi:hypothetical protein